MAYYWLMLVSGEPLPHATAREEVEVVFAWGLWVESKQKKKGL